MPARGGASIALWSDQLRATAAVDRVEPTCRLNECINHGLAITLADDEQVPSKADQINDTSKNKKSNTAATTPTVANAAFISKTNVDVKTVKRIKLNLQDVVRAGRAFIRRR